MTTRSIYDNVTRAKHAGTGTINVRKQCGMRSRYAVKHGGSTRVKLDVF